jgi:hypothetical protein
MRKAWTYEVSLWIRKMSARVCKCVTLRFSTNLKFHIVFDSIIIIIIITTTTTTTTAIGLLPGGSSPRVVQTKYVIKITQNNKTTTKQ